MCATCCSTKSEPAWCTCVMWIESRNNESRDESHDESPDESHDESLDESHESRDESHDESPDKSHNESPDESHDESHEESYDESPDESHDESHDGSHDSHIMTHPCLQVMRKMTCCSWSKNFPTGREREKRKENVQLKRSLSRLLIKSNKVISLRDNEVFGSSIYICIWLKGLIFYGLLGKITGVQRLPA